jgi:hypothetical protein
MPDEKPGSPLETFFGGIPLFRILLSSLGLTGVLISVGYIVVFSREHLLGIALTRSVATAEYATLGARFFADTLVLVYQHAAAHFNTVLALCVIVGVVLTLIERWLVPANSPKSRTAVMAVLFVIMVWKLGYYDIPFVYHKDLLLRRADDFAATLKSNRAAYLWRQFTCRHSAADACNASGQEKLESAYLGNIVLTFLIAYVSVLAMRRKPKSLQKKESEEEPESEPVAPPGGGFVALLTSLILLMSIISVPFVYGKAIWDANLPDVVLTLREKSDSNAKAPAANGAIISASTERPAARSVFGLLVAADDKTVVLYTLTGNFLEEYSRADIDHLRVRGRNDLAGEHIAFITKEEP